MPPPCHALIVHVTSTGTNALSIFSCSLVYFLRMRMHWLRMH